MDALRHLRLKRAAGRALPTWSSLVACLALAWASPAADAQVLVLSPHPDDDIIIGAGVVNRAVDRHEVTVVYMTNGDYTGPATGLVRQAEAVNAQVQFIGTTEDNLIFLGYPDGSLRTIFENYTSPDSQYITAFGQGVTYGNRGLGRQDFHSYYFGSPATYNLPNIVGDLETILRIYRPLHIFTVSEFETHNDHSTTYRILRLALDRIRATDPNYAPVVHKTVVWSSDSRLWPSPVDPTGFHSEVPGLGETTLRWDDRASLDVPLAMQDLNLRTNPKYRAIQSHASQVGPQSFVGRFAHKDEIFWSENPYGTNQPPVADAGLDIYSSPGATVILDGSRSRDPDGLPLAFRWLQRSGTPVSLAGADTMYPGFTVPLGATADHRTLATTCAWSGEPQRQPLDQAIAAILNVTFGEGPHGHTAPAL